MASAKEKLLAKLLAIKSGNKSKSHDEKQKPWKRIEVKGGGKLQHKFSVEDQDHCETPGEAYDDIVPLLMAVCSNVGKRPDELMIYDPYYCNGLVAQNLQARGFHKVYNKNEDFYEAVRSGKTPAFDVLVTNPPYSNDHVERLFSFCTSCDKPWMVLVPNYVYTKDYYEKLLASGVRPFYVIPPTRYEYISPAGSRGSREKKTSPFVSFWFMDMGGLNSNAIRAFRKWMIQNPELERRPQLVQKLRDLPQKMRAMFDPQRRRLRKKQRQAMRRKLLRQIEDKSANTG